MSASAVADIATWYLIGEVIGALFFGQLSDKLGRKNLFMVTLAVYLIGSGLTALTPAGGYWFIFLYGTRVIAGMGIGGEYAAINSAMDEMIPARYRGRVDIAVNGTYWAGAFLGTIVTLIALNHISTTLGWRVAYLVGPVLALVIIFVRRNLPESPRWQIMHGREKEAEASIAEIEEDVGKTKGELPPVDPSRELEIRPTEQIGYLALLRTLFQHYPSRSIYGATLMITQSFLYNAIFFTYGLVLQFFFHVSPGNALLLHGVRRREPARAADHRAAVRHPRQAEDDRRHLPALRRPADHHRAAVQGGRAERGHPDAVLDGDLLLRLGRRVRRVPDRQRDLPAGGPGQGHRGVLRHRAVLRLARLAPVRPPDRRPARTPTRCTGATCSAPAR